jgi:hypothetical protein
MNSVGHDYFSFGLRGSKRTFAGISIIAAQLENSGRAAMLSGRPLTIDHSWDAEPVDQHAKPARPEGLPDQHLNNTAFVQLAQNTLGEANRVPRHPKIRLAASAIEIIALILLTSL